MNWLKKTCAVVLVMAVPILVHGQDDNPAQQTTVTWHQLGELPGDVGRLGRPFIGIHNDALMLAG